MRLLFSAALFVSFVLVCRAQPPAGWPEISLTRLLGGFRMVTHITHAGDSSGRVFIVEQQGRIHVLRNGVPAAAPFLDITSRVSCCGERGLLSVAFPPAFARKRYFYVYYTDRSGDIIIARYHLSGDPDAADAVRQDVILTIPHRQYSNHNGGQLAFGPRDGYLYAGTGDGGGANDPLRSGQDLSTLLGKLLRIDVESGESPYSIPRDNPFTGRAGARAEIWAFGLRNPWRFTFDKATNDLWIGDVGQNAREEVNFQPAAGTGGENYGWSVMEGRQCLRAGCAAPAEHVSPVADYANPAEGCSVTGGYVYRGSLFPSLTGVYLYSDYCSGRFWGLRRGGANWEHALLLQSNIRPTTFGEDEAGNLYVNHYDTGEIYLLAGAQAAPRVNPVPLSPGAIVSLYGINLTQLRGIVQAAQLPLPQALAGTSVTINGRPAPLYAVAGFDGMDQINLQVPYETPASAPARLVVQSGGTSSAAVEFVVQEVSPYIFQSEAGVAAAVVSAGIATFYATGMGPVMNAPPTGAAAPASPLARTTTTPEVRIGGQPAQVLYSGLAPGFAGLYQINAAIPAGVAAGAQPLTIATGGRSSTATLEIPAN
jgi:uncharacterized protein (TIGR03437 family)